MHTIETPRLRLVPVTPRNAGTLWELLQQPDLRTYQDLPAAGRKTFGQMVAARPTQLAAGSTGRFEWLVQFAGSPVPLGWVSLRISDRKETAGEIGYSILREHRGLGVATEAVRALLAQAFDVAGVERVQAFCVPANEPSRRLLKRLNFHSDGILPHGATISGRPVDVLVHKLERDAWVQSGKTIETPASA
ncbi:MAG TPA: GNAT family protein [Candidatus Rubrimentiphilum sp.]|nr:GNAT family protein [Candidatus Rubrimentiphilum sp.]